MCFRPKVKSDPAYIYLFITQINTPATAELARTNAKKGDEKERTKKKGIEVQREKKERNREWVPIPATLDHSVGLNDAQGSYGKPILFSPGLQDSYREFAF